MKLVAVVLGLLVLGGLYAISAAPDHHPSVGIGMAYFPRLELHRNPDAGYAWGKVFIPAWPTACDRVIVQRDPQGGFAASWAPEGCEGNP